MFSSYRNLTYSTRHFNLSYLTTHVGTSLLLSDNFSCKGTSLRRYPISKNVQNGLSIAFWRLATTYRRRSTEGLMNASSEGRVQQRRKDRVAWSYVVVHDGGTRHSGVRPKGDIYQRNAACGRANKRCFA